MLRQPAPLARRVPLPPCPQPQVAEVRALVRRRVDLPLARRRVGWWGRAGEQVGEGVRLLRERGVLPLFEEPLVVEGGGRWGSGVGVGAGGGLGFGFGFGLGSGGGGGY